LLKLSTQDLTALPFVDLTRDLIGKMSQGHQWLFHDVLSDGPNNYKGLMYLKFKNKIIGIGAYDSSSELRFRFLHWFLQGGSVAAIQENFKTRWDQALKKRAHFFKSQNLERTNSFRLIFGEGDFFPGIVIDIFANYAVIQLDRPWLKKVWDLGAWVQQIQNDLPFIHGILLKAKTSDGEDHEVLMGQVPEEITFKENGMLFRTKIRAAAKTGFFLDQRDNRHMLESFSHGARVINFFSYTGGFSVFAARGGAKEVISVDIAKAAIDCCEEHFEMNQLKTKRTHLCADAFEHLEILKKQKEKFDLVVIDPPSFSPSAKSKDNAITAYEKCFSSGAQLVAPNGFIALSSCSGHITQDDFRLIMERAVAKARRKAKVIGWGRQPTDHPYPLGMPELHYLKFCLLTLD
jgi:23S rRNA (cytosine1962-C5)-methyltransferase